MALHPAGAAGGALYLSGMDLVVIAGVRLPGRSSIEGLAAGWKKDAKEKGGAHGGQPSFFGLEAQNFQIRTSTWHDQQTDELKRIAQRFSPQPGKEPEAVTIEHPLLDFTPGIYAFTIDRVQPRYPGKYPTGVDMVFTVGQWLVPAAAKSGGRPGESITVTPSRAPTRNAIRDELRRRQQGTQTPAAAAPSEEPGNFSPADQNFSPGP